jgi:hypothetical protein
LPADASGKTIIITSQKVMEATVLSKTAGCSSSWTTFQRQLNYFGFRREFGTSDLPGKPKLYSNPLFRRDHPEQVERIQRKEGSRKRKRAPANTAEVAAVAAAAETSTAAVVCQVVAAAAAQRQQQEEFEQELHSLRTLLEDDLSKCEEEDLAAIWAAAEDVPEDGEGRAKGGGLWDFGLEVGL